MRGGMFHEHMVSGMEEKFQGRGLRTRRNAPTHKGLATGYIDLLVYGDNSEVLAVEIEMHKRRAVNDIRKREDLGEDAVLWIVTPTQELAQSIKKHLKNLGIEENDKIFVFPFGAAMQRVLIKNPFCFRA